MGTILSGEIFDAVEADDHSAISALAEKGADLNIRDYSSLLQYTPIIAAARLGRINALKALISLGANINAKDRMGFTALMHAAWFNRKEAVTLLTGSGARLEEKNESGNTVLGECAQLGNMEMIKFLIEAGADITVRNKKKHTPHDLARNPEIRLILAVPHKINFLEKFISFFLRSGR